MLFSGTRGNNRSDYIDFNDTEIKIFYNFTPVNKTLHTIYLLFLALIVIAVTYYLAYYGYSYYNTPLEERFYHEQHRWFKPSGIFGQGLGIVGTFLIAFGVFFYMACKRYHLLSRFIRLKYLLEFHIFLCTLGPVLVLFHTTFKFGGIVSIAFWSMVAVVLSGVVGRFIYNQIPRTLEGRELTLKELYDLRQDLVERLQSGLQQDNKITSLPDLAGDAHSNTKEARATLRSTILKSSLPARERKEMLGILRQEERLSKRIARLHTMQRFFKYWHVAHLPFALIMLIIVIIHIAVSLIMGYKWIF